ncbi:MAG: TetR family transcriptional regulator [Chloroflexi bacterium]|nr:MAG: TetR family transcriptional regulator [Chloroflexota bacterium]
MPARDDQDFERRRQRIIDGALDVFASKGFEQATNKDIADAAGVKSPGLIYHYFKDKADLFRQVIEQHAPTVALLNQGDALLELPPRQLLMLIGNAFIKTVDNRRTVAMIKLMLGESLRRPAVAQMLNTIGPARGFALLTRYLEHQMELGVLRPMDAGAAARCFIGSLVGFVMAREVFPQPDSATLSAETMVATAVDVFLGGMLVEHSSTAGTIDDTGD